MTVREYTRRDLSPQAVSEVLELITDIFYCLRRKSHTKRAVLSLETPYDTICVLEVWQYLQLLSEGGPKEESAKKSTTRYIRFMMNFSVD